MKFSIKTLLLAILLIAALVGGYLVLNPTPVEVEVARVAMGALRVSVREDGKTRIREKYTVSAPVSGRISRIELDPGDYCTEQTLIGVIMPGDPALLDARTRAEAAARVQAAAAAVDRARSGYHQAKISVELSQTKFERAQRLLPAQAISQSDYDIAQTDLLASQQALQTSQFDQEIAAYELKMAEAAVRQFSGDQEETAVEPFEIYSPIAGRVLRVLQQSSAVVAVGTPLIEVGDPNNLEIEIDVLSTDAVRIQPGGELTIEHWGGASPLHGYVRVIEPAAFTKISSLGVEEQRVNIIADFHEPPERLSSLGDGYRVEADITVQELNQALLIPNSALFRFRREWHVFTAVAGRAVLQPVTIGLQNAWQTQITAGLKPDDQVIVYPSDTLEPGSRVSLMQ